MTRQRKPHVAKDATWTVKLRNCLGGERCASGVQTPHGSQGVAVRTWGPSCNYVLAVPMAMCSMVEMCWPGVRDHTSPFEFSLFLLIEHPFAITEGVKGKLRPPTCLLSYVHSGFQPWLLQIPLASDSTDRGGTSNQSRPVMKVPLFEWMKLAMGQNPVPPVNIPILIKQGSKFGSEFTYPKGHQTCGPPFGTHAHACSKTHRNSACRTHMQFHVLSPRVPSSKS